MRRLFSIHLALIMAAACATGVESGGVAEDEESGATASGGSTAAGTSTLSGTPQGSTTQASTTQAGVGGATTTTTAADTSATTGATSAASTTAATTVATTTTTTTTTSSAVTTTGGGGTCNPLNPALVCGAGHHCVPQPNGTPLCTTPTGLGGQYGACTTSAECGPIYECVFTGFFDWCMQWCSSDLDCPSYPIDTCYPLSPAVYVGGQEWGVCYDGNP